MAGALEGGGGGKCERWGGGVGHGLGARTRALKTLLFMAGTEIQVK